MIGLTPRCAKLLSFIETRIRRERVAPTYEEMMAHTGFKSRNTIQQILRSLERRGHIRILPRQARAIELISQTANCPHCGNYLGAKPAPAVTYSHSSSASR